MATRFSFYIHGNEQDRLHLYQTANPAFGTFSVGGRQFFGVCGITRHL
jgi:hypothetical protein